MGYHFIPISPRPDQLFNVSVEVDESILNLDIRLHYNFAGRFWKMDVFDGLTKECMISNQPMLVGCLPAQNILRQFTYMGLGSAMIVPVVNKTDSDSPVGGDLGAEFNLVWGDYDGS